LAKIGLFPDYGGTYFLPQLVGPAKAAEMFYTGDMIDAQTALKLGLVNRVVPGAQLEAEVKKFAAKLAAGPPICHARCQADAVWQRERRSGQGAGGRGAASDEMLCFRTIAWKAFALFEKRPPAFKGR